MFLSRVLEREPLDSVMIIGVVGPRPAALGGLPSQPLGLQLPIFVAHCISLYRRLAYSMMSRESAVASVTLSFGNSCWAFSFSRFFH